ncbi:MAG: glutamine-hydrolyzing carbamoyl-phosphate synthase small subunit [Solirubrobacteraceae bacterium]
MSDATAYVLLEDGARFDGLACAADTPAVGEVVFTTSMSGYQEAMTDPSYAAQLIAFTYPQIGNYGVSDQAMESDRIHARAAIMRAAIDRDDAPRAQQGWLSWLRAHGVPAITDLDTRALVRHLRERGAMLGGVFPARIAETEARELIAAEPPMSGRDLARELGPPAPVVAGVGPGNGFGAAVAAGVTTEPVGDPLQIALIDTGVKRSIIRNLMQRGAQVTLYPCTVGAQELLGTDADAVFLANGPGDPAALDYLVATVRELVGKRPVYGICLGHQVLCQAIGLETYKLPFGHHGANHPVKDLATGRTEITSQNHGFAVLGPGGARTIEGDQPVRWQTDFGEAQLSHINLYDRTVEGLTLLDVHGATVQYHPEAGPGPHDALHLFDRFIDEIRDRRSR